MATPAGYERLSSQDATLLCAESPGAPLQIGALCLFEGGPLLDRAGRVRIDDLRGHVAGRLGAVPRFRQKMLPVPFGRGRPVWVDDPSFDISNHVRTAALAPPGGPAELRTWMSSLLEGPLDRSRPLWEVWVVTGVAGDRVAVVPKINHVMADGMAALEFALSVLDTDPAVPERRADRWVPRPAPAAAPLLIESLADEAGGALRGGLAAAAALRHPRSAAASAARLARALISTAETAPRLPITGPVGARRDFAWVRLPLDDLRRVSRLQGVTLNDVVLSVVGGALGHYLGNETVRAGVRPRVLVPVSMHSRAGEVENLFSMMVADLPLGPADPMGRLRLTHAEMVARKSSGQTAVGPALFAVGDLVDRRLLRRVAPVVLRRQPFVNLAVTNLPGSGAELYLMGSRLEELFPFVTVTGNIALIIGALSYTGTMGVGLTADADVIRDLPRLAEGVELAASELFAAAGAGCPRSTVATT